MDLQPEMRDILMRNGMQAHIVPDGAGYSLVVQGHDSPLLAYPITERQMLALTDWGTNTANKKAYNVFTSIVGNDFICPKISSMPGTPTAVSRWDFTDTASVSANTDAPGGGGCHPRSSDGRPASNGAFTCAGSVGSCFIPAPLSPNAGTDG